MPKIFFCYRREDSVHQAGRIYDRFELVFGKSLLFKDTVSIRSGLDFRPILTEQVDQSDILLAIIGDTWLTCQDETGRRRLDDPNDFVRFEIEAALNRTAIEVVPVLVGLKQVSVPKASELPESMRELSFRQEIRIRIDPDFNNDIEKLISNVRESLASRSGGAPTQPPPPPPEPPVPDPTLTSTFGLSEKSCIEFMENLRREAAGESGPSPIREIKPKPVTGAPQETTLRIGLLKSGNVSYVHEIEREFLRHLGLHLPALGIRLETSADSVEREDETDWASTVKRLMVRGGAKGFHYLVGIGTQAAIAFQRVPDPIFDQLPTLLLGVTYPRSCALVDGEHYRCETRQVACIRYGCGLDAVASLLHHRLFPGRNLCFVYQAGVHQDELARIELESTRLHRAGLLRFKKLEKKDREGKEVKLKLDDLADPKTIYFSWYTFSKLFYENEFSILRNRLSVSIMQESVREGVTMAGVGTDHEWIGQRGAEMLLEHVTAPADAKPDWGATDVLVSPLTYWLNRTVARRNGIEFSPAALAQAERVYD